MMLLSQIAESFPLIDEIARNADLSGTPQATWSAIMARRVPSTLPDRRQAAYRRGRRGPGSRDLHPYARGTRRKNSHQLSRQGRQGAWLLRRWRRWHRARGENNTLSESERLQSKRVHGRSRRLAHSSCCLSSSAFSAFSSGLIIGFPYMSSWYSPGWRSSLASPLAPT